MDQATFKRYLKFKVLNQLKPQRRNIASSGQIIMKKGLFNKLKSFGVTGRYKPNAELMEYLELENRRYFGPTLHFRDETFQARVSNQKTVAYLDKNLNQHDLSSNCYAFWYRFIRHEEH